MKMLSQIPRGQDLEGMIKQTQHLRTLNRKLVQTAKKLYQIVIQTLNINPPDTQSRSIVEATNNLIQHIAQSAQQPSSTLQKHLEEERRVRMHLEQRHQQDQTTINELTLIAQRLQQEAEENRMELDRLRLEIEEQRHEVHKSEQAQVKWHTRYELLKEDFDKIRREQLSLINGLSRERVLDSMEQQQQSLQ